MYLSLRQVVENCGGVAAAILKKIVFNMRIKEKLAKEDGTHINIYQDDKKNTSTAYVVYCPK